MADSGSLEHLEQLIEQMDDKIIVSEAVQEHLKRSSLGDFMMIMITCINRNMDAIRTLGEYIRRDQIELQRTSQEPDGGNSREPLGAAEEG